MIIDYGEFMNENIPQWCEDWTTHMVAGSLLIPQDIKDLLLKKIPDELLMSEVWDMLLEDEQRIIHNAYMLEYGYVAEQSKGTYGYVKKPETSIWKKIKNYLLS